MGRPFGNLRKKVESSFPSFLPSFLPLSISPLQKNELSQVPLLSSLPLRTVRPRPSASFFHAEEIGQNMHEVALSLNKTFCLRGPPICSVNGGFIFDRVVKTLCYPLRVFL